MKKNKIKTLNKKPLLNESFRTDEAVLQRAEKKMFGNSKIQKEQVIIKKVKK